ncbi:MAG: hypothetical protein Q4C95_10010 [Planctomycetia bacterium]|nr:hypothetical protein [Planctomycetia bacterium]
MLRKKAEFLSNLRNGLIGGLLVLAMSATIFASDRNNSTLEQQEPLSAMQSAEISSLYAQVYTTYYPPIYSSPVVVGPTITTYYPAPPIYVGPPVIVRPWRPFLNAFLP